MSRRYSASTIAVIKKRETETWIYSYADLITNLLALFVMLLIVLTGTKSEQQDLKRGIEKYTKATTVGTGNSAVPTTAEALDELRQVFSQLINTAGLNGQVSLERTRTGVALTFESALLFESGTAKLNDEALTVLAQVAVLLAAMPARFVVDVEGHADRRPVTSGRYPSNWELSSARAGSVVRVLESQGVQSKRLRAIGFAATRPVDDTGESDENRRVVIKVNAEGNRE